MARANVNLDLDLMRTFLAVVDSGGFTRATSRIGRTQSTVSLHLRRLEELAGAQLLDRNGRQVRLTEEGEVLRGYAESMIQLNDEAYARLTSPKITGAIRVGVPEDFATRQLPQVLRRFTKAHPAVGLEVRSALSAELHRALNDCDLDLVIARRHVGQEDDGATPVWREPLVWTQSAEHEPHLQDPMPLVMFPHGCLYRPQVVKRLEGFQRRWQIAYTSTSLAGVQAAVLAGMGVTVLAKSTLLPQFRTLGIAEGLPELPETEIAIYRRKGLSSEVADALSHFVRVTLEIHSSVPPD